MGAIIAEPTRWRGVEHVYVQLEFAYIFGIRQPEESQGFRVCLGLYFSSEA
jgi:hypothetical protein